MAMKRRAKAAPATKAWRACGLAKEEKGTSMAGICTVPSGSIGAARAGIGLAMARYNAARRLGVRMAALLRREEKVLFFLKKKKKKN
jgi:tetrahydromethanopterin S-methyltransferase subunit D